MWRKTGPAARRACGRDPGRWRRRWRERRSDSQQRPGRGWPAARRQPARGWLAAGRASGHRPRRRRPWLTARPRRPPRTNLPPLCRPRRRRPPARSRESPPDDRLPGRRRTRCRPRRTPSMVGLRAATRAG
ncbi:MAG: hypothetical protein FJ284_06715 [Planctomycetes bacterium]|nr:hypothetical protein [Planctomycetota bacterium]